MGLKEMAFVEETAKGLKILTQCMTRRYGLDLSRQSSRRCRNRAPQITSGNTMCSLKKKDLSSGRTPGLAPTWSAPGRGQRRKEWDRVKLGLVCGSWSVTCISQHRKIRKRANRSGQPRHVPYSSSGPAIHSKPHSPVHQAISAFWGLPHQPPLLFEKTSCVQNYPTCALVILLWWLPSFQRGNAYALGREEAERWAVVWAWPRLS